LKENLPQIDEFLLNTYLDIDEQELQVCRMVVWTIHDFCRSNVAEYGEIIARMLLSECRRRDIFMTIKDIENAIQRLIHRGILCQDLDRVGNGEPFIVLSFARPPDEATRAINEIFSRDILAFFGPQTNYDSLPSIKP